MRYVIAGKDAQIKIPLVDERGEVLPFSPDGAYGSWEMIDKGGDVIASGKLDTSDFTEGKATVALPANSLTLQEGKSYKQCFLTVNVLHGDGGESYNVPFKIISFVPISVTALEVRKLLGVDAYILGDDSVDLYESYYQLSKEQGEVFSDAIFGDDEDKYFKANRAIALKCAIGLCPTLQVVVPKTETDSIVSQTRFNIDFGALEKSLKSELDAVLSEISGESVPNTELLVGSVTDVFTGG